MEEELLKIFSEFLDDQDDLEQEEKAVMMQLGERAGEYMEFFYACYACICNEKGNVELPEKGLSFSIEETCHLTYKSCRIRMEEETARELLSKLIDIFEPVYPLGTLVELKEEFTEALHLKKQTGKLKVVIIERFSRMGDKNVFFPYAGTVYPVGTLGQGQFIHFTGALIDSVIREGYRDEMEDAYILLMKRELLVEKQAVSFGFLKKEKQAEYMEAMGVKKKAAESKEEPEVEQDGKKGD